MIRPIYYFSRAVVRVYYRVYHRLRVRGLDSVPMEGPVLFVANHASFLDPPLVAISNRRVVYSLARSTLGRFPPARWILSAVATLFVDREGSARAGIEVAVRALKAGDALTIFPEGTRTRDGQIGPFKRGALLILSRCPATVVPVGVRGTWRAFPRGAWFPRPRRCEIVFGEPISAEQVMAPGGFDELRARVAALVEGAADGSAVVGGQESGNPGDSAAPNTAEYAAPRSGPNRFEPMRASVEGRRRWWRVLGDCIPRSSFNLHSLPRFI